MPPGPPRKVTPEVSQPTASLWQQNNLNNIDKVRRRLMVQKWTMFPMKVSGRKLLQLNLEVIDFFWLARKLTIWDIIRRGITVLHNQRCIKHRSGQAGHTWLIICLGLQRRPAIRIQPRGFVPITVPIIPKENFLTAKNMKHDCPSVLTPVIYIH